jgi:hypothetical protein
MQAATTEKPFRHPVQTFTWFRTEWDIAKLLSDYDAGRLKPAKLELDRQFIDGYATSVLALRKDRALDAQPMSLFMARNAPEAVALPAQALEEPVILLELAPGRGIMQLDGRTSPDHILADGQHRMTKAYFEDVQRMPAIVLSRTQARRYLMR